MSRFLLMAVALAACQSPTVPSTMREPSHARGTVTAHQDVAQGRRFLLEQHPDSQSGEKFYVTVNGDTHIFRRTQSGDTLTAEVREVPVRSQAEVWFEGPILESYPAQGVAKYVLIHDVVVDR